MSGSFAVSVSTFEYVTARRSREMRSKADDISRLSNLKLHVSKSFLDNSSGLTKFEFKGDLI